MKRDFETNIVLDQFGNVDITYYELQARRMRSEAFFSSMKALATLLRKGVSQLSAGVKNTASQAVASQRAVSREA